MFVLKKYCGKRLKKLCETRWSDKMDALLEFTVKLNSVAEALEKISNWQETATDAKAKIHLRSLFDVELITALHCQVNKF